jgi:hypothetical protein
VPVGLPTSRIAKAAASAWDRIAKYAPRTLRRNVASPSTAATAAGSSRIASSVTISERNGSHHHGTPSDEMSAMKSGVPPGPASASFRCIAIR